MNHSIKGNSLFYLPFLRRSAAAPTTSKVNRSFPCAESDAQRDASLLSAGPKFAELIGSGCCENDRTPRAINNCLRR